MEKTKFYMMIGIAGSGKSFLANQLGVPVVSSDAIRAELFGSEDDQSHNDRVFNELHKRIKNYLKEGKDCVYDATNLSRSRRKKFLKEIPADVQKIAIVAATEIEVILEQNRQRMRHVPEEVIWKMYKSLTLPRADEGWDDIRMIPHPRNTKTLPDYLYAAYGMDHDNPHHSANIFDHMIEAGSYAYRNAEKFGLDKVERKTAHHAALFHDIGKPVVKSRMKANGQMDDKSHYYNHAEIGAYMAACCVGQFVGKQWNWLAQMIILIQWHMESYADPEGYLDKFESLYGSRMRKMYEFVHEADVNAH